MPEGPKTCNTAQHHTMDSASMVPPKTMSNTKHGLHLIHNEIKSMCLVPKPPSDMFQHCALHAVGGEESCMTIIRRDLVHVMKLGATSHATCVIANSRTQHCRAITSVSRTHGHSAHHHLHF